MSSIIAGFAGNQSWLVPWLSSPCSHFVVITLGQSPSSCWDGRCCICLWFLNLMVCPVCPSKFTGLQMSQVTLKFWLFSPCWGAVASDMFAKGCSARGIEARRILVGMSEADGLQPLGTCGFGWWGWCYSELHGWSLREEGVVNNYKYNTVYIYICLYIVYHHVSPVHQA